MDISKKLQDNLLKKLSVVRQDYEKKYPDYEFSFLFKSIDVVKKLKTIKGK